MREEELIKKLENVELPKADPKEHQRLLRAALLARDSRPRRSWSAITGEADTTVGVWKTIVAELGRSPRWTRRLAAMCSVALVIIALVLAVTPFLEGQSPAAQAAEIARNSREVKEALGGGGGQVIRVIEDGETSVVILKRAGDATGSGNVVVASVDMTRRTVTSATIISSPHSESACSDWQALVGRPTCDGVDIVFLSTPLELRAISNGVLLWSVMAAGRPEVLINDVTGDGIMDLVASAGAFIECYNGATGEKVWQFECAKRRVFLNGMGWGSEDSYVSSVAILGTRDPQSICVHTDWQVACLDARDGKELWQFRSPERVTAMATAPDRDGDGRDEVLIGTHEGSLCLTSGDDGTVRWKRHIGTGWLECGELQHGRIVTIEVTEDHGNAAVVGVGDGRVCMIDLEEGNTRWESQITFRELSNSVRLWLIPDVTGDNISDVVVNKGYARNTVGMPTTPGGVESTSTSLWALMLLSGCDGGEVWSGQMHTMGGVISTVNSQPVALELHPQLGIRIVSLRDGQTEACLPIPALGSTPAKLGLMSDGGYLLYSEDGDLTALAPSGELRWSYSKMNNAKVELGEFNHDATPDLLVLGGNAGEDCIRQISVWDGAVRQEIWHCDVAGLGPSAVAGLHGVRVVSDLTGDGIDDIVGWAGQTVFKLDGADGSLSLIDIGRSIVSLQPVDIRFGASGFMAGTADGLILMDGDGSTLWESRYTDWSTSEVGAFQVMNDLNQDGVSDLVLSFSDSVLVATSNGANPLSFDLLRSFTAGENKAMELKELTNDIDGDDSQEIALFEFDRGASAAGGTLLVVSPVTGRVWHRWDMPVTVCLACADFNGDGFQDTLLHREGGFSEGLNGTHRGQVYAQTVLEVCSGKDDGILWARSFDEDRWHAGSEKMPATPVGDLSGDGIEDLAVSSIAALSDGIGIATDSAGTMETRFVHETHVSVYEITSGTLLKEIVVPRAQKDSQVVLEESNGGWSDPVHGPGDVMRLAGDVNGDGWQELAVLASYLPTGGHCLTLVDLQNEDLLGYLAALNTLDFFWVNEHCTVGFTSDGSVCLGRLASGLRVTCPGEGETVGSHVRIAWEGAGESSLFSVFVDGYENVQTRENEAILPLMPGQHEVVVRSIDRYGTVTYATVHFRTEGARWVSVLACLSVVALFLVYFAVRLAGIVRNRAARRAGL